MRKNTNRTGLLKIARRAKSFFPILYFQISADDPPIKHKKLKRLIRYVWKNYPKTGFVKRQPQSFFVKKGQRPKTVDNVVFYFNTKRDAKEFGKAVDKI